MNIFGIKKSPFKESAAILAEEGFSQGYIEKLREETDALKKPADLAKGRSFLINALIIRGELTEAYSLYSGYAENGGFERLDKLLYPNLLHNVIFSLFIRDKFKEAERIYKELNHIVLSDKSDTMKRTLALHECMNGRYENAVTVLARLMGSDCRFVDLCLVKTVLKLDMYERAAELSAGFGFYEGKGELAKEAAKLKKKTFDGLSPKSKVKMVKRK